jgi:hypothetical protein
LRQGGDFDLLFLTTITIEEINNPARPCKERRDKGAAPAGVERPGKAG